MRGNGRERREGRGDMREKGKQRKERGGREGRDKIEWDEGMTGKGRDEEERREWQGRDWKKRQGRSDKVLLPGVIVRRE